MLELDINNLTKEDIENIKLLPIVNPKTIEDLNDTEKYQWVQIKVGKNCVRDRVMYCLKTGIKRKLTFDEYYNGTIMS